MTKKAVGSANGSAVRGAGMDGSTVEFAVVGMGLQALSEALVKKLRRRRQLPPPARNTLDAVASQPCKVDPGSQGEDEEEVTVAVQHTSEQQGQDARDRFTEAAKQRRLARAALEKAAGAEQCVLGAGRRVPQRGEDRTGLGIGYGVLDAVYTPDAGALPEVRYGRNYVDSRGGHQRWPRTSRRRYQDSGIGGRH